MGARVLSRLRERPREVCRCLVERGQLGRRGLTLRQGSKVALQTPTLFFSERLVRSTSVPSHSRIYAASADRSFARPSRSISSSFLVSTLTDWATLSLTLTVDGGRGLPCPGQRVTGSRPSTRRARLSPAPTLRPQPRQHVRGDT